MQPVQPSATVIAIDDEPQVLEMLSAALSSPGTCVLTETDPVAGLELVLRERPAIVLLDLNMPKMNGMEVLERIVAADPAIDVILVTAEYSTSAAVEAVQHGAADYLTKPVNLERLRERVALRMQERRRRADTLQLEKQLLECYQFQGVVGRSPQMLERFTLMQRVAPHFTTALITGETGTGKELVAIALHKLSPAGKGPFVVCNCSALVQTLAESQLFGYVRGAFTGANQDTAGLFEAANRGTLFLDEIGELPLPLQAKLLRVLQDHEVQRLGSTQTRHVDLRVIAATNRDLQQMVAEGSLRNDLYYRLSMVQIHLPPLRERREDLPYLERFFVEQFASEFKKPVRGLSQRVQKLFARYDWPGNVRELENVIGRACMIAGSEFIDISDLPESFATASQAGTSGSGLLSLEELEEQHVLRVLTEVGGNKQKAIEILGISRSTLYNILARVEHRHSSQRSANAAPEH